MAHRIPEETKRSIMEAARIDEVVGEFVVLKKRGANLWGCCPFHNEKTPSFSVSPAKNFFKCFGCGKAGDSVTFLMEHEHYSYVEALRWLAHKYNIEIEEQELTPEQVAKETERETLYHVTQFAAEFFAKNLWESEEGRSIGLSYFRERRFSDDMIKRFQLGYCPDDWDTFTKTALKAGYDKKFLVQTGLTIEKEETGKLFDRFKGRVIFPILSSSGRVLGFGGRILGSDKSKAKYVNSPESDIYHKSQVLFALPFAKKEIIAQDTAYMVEGYADVVSMHQAGITNVVASSGTSLTEDQIKLISRFTKNLTLLYDGDPAGIHASLRGIDMVLAKDMNVRVVLLPDGQDPDDYAKAHTTDEIKDYLNRNAVDFITFKTQLLLKDVGTDPIKRAELIENILTSISVIPDTLKRSVYVQECSRLMGISEADLVNKLNRILRGKFQQTLKQEGNESSVSPQTLTLPASQPGKDEAEADSQQHTLLLERELLRLMVNYGAKNTVQMYRNENGESVEQISSVCAYIVTELENDGLEFSSLLHARLFKIFSDGLKAEVIPSSEDLMLLDDAEIRTLTADLGTPAFEVSGEWEKKGVYPQTEQTSNTKLNAAVFQAVMNFRLKKINGMIADVDRQLKELSENPEGAGTGSDGEMRLFELIRLKKELDALKAGVSAYIRRVVS